MAWSSAVYVQAGILLSDCAELKGKVIKFGMVLSKLLLVMIPRLPFSIKNCSIGKN